MMLKITVAGFASMVEMLVREALTDGQLKGFEPDPSNIQLMVRKDDRVPGGWAVSATGHSFGIPSENQPEVDWLLSGDTGISSEVIFYYMTGKNGKYVHGHLDPHDENWPHDVSDFGRCFRLLERFPEWRERLPTMATQFPGWKPLLDIWTELEAVYRKEQGQRLCNETYAMMQGLGDACRVSAGWVKEGPGSWTRP